MSDECQSLLLILGDAEPGSVVVVDSNPGCEHLGLAECLSCYEHDGEIRRWLGIQDAMNFPGLQSQFTKLSFQKGGICFAGFYHLAGFPASRPAERGTVAAL